MALKLLRNSSSSNSNNNSSNNIGSSNSNYNYDACVCSCCNDTYCYNIVCDDDKCNNGINYSGSTSTCSFNNKNNNNNPDINNQPQRGCICDKTLNPVCSHRYSINIVLLPDDVNSRRMLLPASRCSSCTHGGYSRGYHGLHQTILQWIYRKCKSSMAGRSSDENAELFCPGERNKSTNHASHEPPSDEHFFSSQGNKLYCLSEHLLVEDFKNLKSLPETSIKMNPPIHDVL
ncbi:hypothetical protein HELRODRAFT_159499 [Helobdella robusta]|uniref:Uncharacterized protein n=1 Tax=Helobdella robusta TaxID=6412 RepID=T1EP37_HELRO|nr:hypothetical protein HELRODRAFT_159499 [Helobdella robusta]ESO12911.1 hypothetical protein HELRODRAFT_159499 [Helobdella robusta]